MRHTYSRLFAVFLFFLAGASVAGAESWTTTRAGVLAFESSKSSCIGPNGETLASGMVLSQVDCSQADDWYLQFNNNFGSRVQLGVRGSEYCLGANSSFQVVLLSCDDPQGGTLASLGYSLFGLQPIETIAVRSNQPGVSRVLNSYSSTHSGLKWALQSPTITAGIYSRVTFDLHKLYHATNVRSSFSQLDINISIQGTSSYGQALVFFGSPFDSQTQYLVSTTNIYNSQPSIGVSVPFSDSNRPKPGTSVELFVRGLFFNSGDRDTINVAQQTGLQGGFLVDRSNTPGNQSAVGEMYLHAVNDAGFDQDFNDGFSMIGAYVVFDQ